MRRCENRNKDASEGKLEITICPGQLLTPTDNSCMSFVIVYNWCIGRYCRSRCSQSSSLRKSRELLSFKMGKLTFQCLFLSSSPNIKLNILFIMVPLMFKMIYITVILMICEGTHFRVDRWYFWHSLYNPSRLLGHQNFIFTLLP